MNERVDFDVRREVLRAEQRIRRHIRQTPLEPSIWLGRQSSCEVYLKLENLQVTSSFKYRGAANKILSLTEEERRQGVVTASTGNHGSAVASLLRQFGIPGRIFVPETASPAKIETMRTMGAELVLHGTDGVESERAAREAAAVEGLTYISPYNDPLIVGGQGTVGLEVERQLEGVEVVYCPVGGGGLAAGVAGYLKSSEPRIRFVGCQPVRSAVMCESVGAGHIVERESQPTLADGTAGGVEKGTVTFPLCRDLIDEFVLVEEAEIAAAMRLMLERHHLLVEGAAALSIAAFLRARQFLAGKRVVLIVSGARVSLEILRRVLADVENGL